MLLYKEWEHVFKLDPNKSISDEALEQLCESGTDAVIVGGSDGVTLDNTLFLLGRIRHLLHIKAYRIRFLWYFNSLYSR